MKKQEEMCPNYIVKKKNIHIYQKCKQPLKSVGGTIGKLQNLKLVCYKFKLFTPTKTFFLKHPTSSYFMQIILLNPQFY